MLKTENCQLNFSDAAERPVDKKALQMVFDCIDCGIVLVDPTTRQIEEINQKALEIMGIEPDDVIGQNCQRFFCRSFTGECPVTCLGHVIDGQENTLLCANSQIKSVKRTVKSILLDGEQKLLESFTDVTKAQQAEAALFLFDVAIQSTSEGIMLINADGRVESFNDTFEQMWEIPAYVARSGDYSAALTYLLDKLEHPQTFIEKFKKWKVDQTTVSSINVKSKDGRIFEWKTHPQNINAQLVGRIITVKDVTEDQIRLSHISNYENKYADKIDQLTDTAKLILKQLQNIAFCVGKLYATELNADQQNCLKIVKASTDSLIWTTNNILDNVGNQDFKTSKDNEDITANEINNSTSGEEYQKCLCSLSGADAEQNNSSVVVLSKLMENVDSDKGLLNKLIELYLAEYQNHLAVLNQALKESDWKIVKHIAHKMKSSAGVFAADFAHDSFSKLEKLCDYADGASIEAAIISAQKEAKKLAEYLLFFKLEEVA